MQPVKVAALVLVAALAVAEAAVLDAGDQAQAVGEDGAEAAVETDEDARIDPATGRRMYTGFQMIRVRPENDQQIDVIRFLEKVVSDVWSPIPLNISLLRHVDLLVAPSTVAHVKNFLNCSGVDYDVPIQDLQKTIDEENVEVETDLKSSPDDLFPRDKRSPQLRQLRRPPRQQQGGGGLRDALRGVFGLDGPPSPPNVRQGRHFRPSPSNGPLANPSDVDNVAPDNLAPNRPILPTSPTAGACLGKTGMHWRNYQRAATIYAFLDCLAADHPDLVQSFDIGSSSENRPLRVLKIGKPASDGTQKPAVWIDGGIHAREWISPAAVTYITNELVENYDQNKDLLDKYDLYILPMANPDGYEYTQKDRMWRKTRSRTTNALSADCTGVDPNRNWGYRWGGKGASGNPCTETYRGPHPFSEPETKAISDFILSKKDNIKMYLTFHSYGQFILYPWGYEAEVSAHHNELHRVGVAAADAMLRASGNQYSVGTAAKMLYPAAGGSDDWAHGGAGIPYSYTIELPDAGNYGFLLPAHRIEGVGREAFEGVKAMVAEIRF